MEESAILQLCGLGTRPGEETTCETLLALSKSRVVFCDIGDPVVKQWLRPYCRRLVALDHDDIEGALRRVLGECGRGGTVSVAVWGHPALTSSLCQRLLRRRRKGIRVFGAVSPVGSAFARAVCFFGGDYGYQGIQARSVEGLSSAAAPLKDLPLVVFRDGPGDWCAAAGRLRRWYPSAQRCNLYPAGQAAQEAVPLASLAAIPGEPGPGVLLLLPEKPARRGGAGHDATKGER